MAEDFKIFFVKPQLNEENGLLLVKAFEELTKAEFNFKSEWVSTEDCMKVEGKGKQIYIFDAFEGAAFEHIRELGYRTYGPLCILGNLLHGLELPKHKRKPVLNLAMKNVKVCCTSIDRSIREEITRKVFLMGGDVDSNLTADVTHLVAGEVGSNKYLVAVQNGKAVMTKEWVDAVWEASQNKHISGLDDTFDKYVCPPFLGLTICVSGFSSSERNKMRNFVMRGGGKYSGELKMNECTHLVVKEPKGAKYEAAKTWKIRIVKDLWLYESMDKQKYIDPKPYQFNATQEKNIKTSTPERRSVLGPHIADISAISCGANTSIPPVDETKDMTTSRMSEQFDLGVKNCIAESKMGTTALDMDATRSSVDIVLDGCKIYLSGLKQPIEEKIRKIISVSGALKSSMIDSSITHVIIGDVVPSDVVLLSKLKKCPYVVNVDWIMDSFSKNFHLSEAKYERTDLGLITPSMRKNDPKSNEVTTTSDALSSSKEDKSNKSSDKTTDSQAFRMEAPSDMEMAELLSQYSVQEGKTTQPSEQKNIRRSESSQNETLKALETEAQEGLTQDPNDLSDADPAPEEGIFSRKSFTVLGFDEEEMAQLNTFIIERGGQILQNNEDGRSADIAIVPLMGYPVDVPVAEVLTNAWLQMCIEVEQFLPYEDCWLARPIDLPDEELLMNCCISVSGYVGVERECITHLCQSMGAKCQDHFARRSSKNVEASTHLIVNYPTGTKYNAAKKWGIPAVGKEWVFSCITSGKRVAEADYNIDVLEQKRLAKLQEKDAMDAAAAAKQSATSTSLESLPSPTRKSKSDMSVDIDEGKEGVTDNGGQRSFQEESKTSSKQCVNGPPREISQEIEDRIPTSSVESSDSCSKAVVELNPMAEICRHLKPSTPTVSAGVSNLTRLNTSNSACRPNQSENITAGKLRTPVDVARQKWASSKQSPVSDISTPVGLIKGGGETPGTFMQPGYRPKFNMDELIDTSEDSVNLNKSTPLGEVFRRHISKGAQNIEAKYLTAQDDAGEEMAASQSQPEELPPLHGVVIAVAKKLGRSHAMYNTIVVELGGTYSWHSGPDVTHFVFQGRPNDTNKEFRKAREEGKIIVSPHWLTACQEQKCRVDESIFPHSFNPSCSLTLTPARRGTPRNTRAMVKNTTVSTESTNAATSTPSSKTPRKMPVLNLQKSLQAETPERKAKSADDSNQPPSPSETTLTKVPNHAVDKVSEEPPDLSVETPTGEGKIAESNLNLAKTTDLSASEIADRNKNQEMKEALTKTLGTVLAQASRSKRSMRKKGKLMNLSGQMSTPDNSLGESNISNTASTVWSNKNKETKQALAPEPSQSLQVTWDDPTERLEKEKLAHRLEAVCEPSQNTDELLAGIDVPNLTPSHQEKTNSKTTAKFNERSPTPEPPPLAFPVAQPSSRVLSPQPVELLSEESSDSRPGNKPPPVPVFLISGMTNEERVDYSALVEQLGGKMVEIQYFDPSATHLVVGQPARNEKYLSCIASGKWVLHKSYFEACRKEGKFVKARPSCHGAFDGWKVLLCMAKNKEDNFHRLLEAGGAEVSSIKSPFPADVQGTHAFLDLNKVPVQQEDLENLIHAGIHCLKAEYIPAYLTEEPPPEPSDFYPAEVISLKASMPETSSLRKRQHLNEDSTPSMKRVRKH
ncbi:DNA topoisomerase 2-binding protein 1 [Plakobranchus ocellatus]|uniref:DNA topoisomerase 2-binding protein 1 n=2 Tax=Plakobranchus ocellatus TaxID=259542 RepID=A0AAV4C1K6_9GAST|nr:DNA topoisomerase 2-binding protein 1 [Plakobranchus ocellatus]